MGTNESDWIVGEPPRDKDVCWLEVRGCIVERGEPDTYVLLAVFDGDSWCEAGCWRGVTCLDPIQDEILAFRDYVIPEPPMIKGAQSAR